MKRAASEYDGMLAQLVYELLDAHGDTIDLAEELAGDGVRSAGDGAWRVHLDYLRSLQRKGREMLARACSEDQP